MTAYRRLHVQPPGASIYRLYTASWIFLLFLGTSYFLQNNLVFRLTKIKDMAEFLLVVATPALADHVLTDQGDKIQIMLGAVTNNLYIESIAISTLAGEVKWQSQSTPLPDKAPLWLNSWLKTQLATQPNYLPLAGRPDLRLDLRFNITRLANEFWAVVLRGVTFALLLAGIGIFLSRRLLKRLLADLSKLSQQAEVTLGAISEGIVGCTEQFKLLSINPAALRLLGFSAQDKPQLLGQDIRLLLPSLFHGHEASPSWPAHTHQFTRQDGEQVMLETGFTIVQDNAPLSVCKVLTLMDVSHVHALAMAQQAELAEHKNAIASMRRVAESLPLSALNSPAQHGVARANELNYLTAWVLEMVAERENSRLALEHQKYAIDQHAIVVIWDMNGVISYANDRFCAIGGCDRKDVIGQKQRLITPDGRSAPDYFQMVDAVSQGLTWQGDLQCQNKQGREFWVNATVVPLYNEFLIQDRAMLIGTDITQEQQSKAQLSEQLALMEVLLEALPIAVYFKDKLGRHFLVNHAFELLVGLSRAEVIGKTSFDLLPSAFAQFSFEKDQDLRVTGGVQIFETPYLNHHTGRESDFFYSKALTTDEQGNITGIVGVILDVTERNLNQWQLQEATRLAESANQAKSNFLANVSHELRTPLNGVIGMTELALDLALDAQQRDYLSLAKNSAQALMGVVNDILDISKIEANRVDIESAEFSLAEVIQHSLRPMQALASKKGLVFDLELSPKLQDHVLGDPTRLRQLLRHLCDNAIKFTPKGQVTVRVMGTPTVAGAFDLLVTVADTGIGIAAEQQSCVFGLFNQADASTTRKYGGSGLGLTISQKLAVLMGGGITLKSELGQGSTFTLKVRLSVPQPVLALATPRLEALPTPSQPQATPSLPAALQVLLVEDNLVNQMLCTTILKKIGHTVAVASHGQEAVAMFGKQAWDVILMDMQMPMMDGLEATRAIRALELSGQHTPIVAMTANAMMTDRQLCLDAGMDDYLSKPFKFADLQVILEKAVSEKVAFGA